MTRCGERDVAFGQSLDRVRGLLLVELAHLSNFVSELAEIGVECARRVIDHNGLRRLTTTFRPRQLRVIKAQLSARTTYDAHIESPT